MSQTTNPGGSVNEEPYAPETPTTDVNGEHIQTVTVEATRLPNWGKILLGLGAAYLLWQYLEKGEEDVL